jgi:SNF2 family DNA or RNA helicase
VDGSITPEIRALLHAGDVQTVLQQLGVQGDTPLSLIQAVSENRVRELDRLKKTYEFKSSIEYHTPQAKELALAHLQSKIKHLEEQIQSIRERIENFEKEICPICFDEPVSAVLTHCCSRIFCAACILNSLARNTACPLCRTATRPSELRRISSTAINTIVQPETQKPLKKREQLLKLLEQNPKGKFLIFSRYDNPFIAIEQELQQLNIKVRQVKGNKDAIQNTLNSFAKGEIQCLLLNSLHAGSGLTITAATHVILLHAMNIEEEKQILGRAYRLGRTTPLTMYRLLHPDEYSES